MKSAPGNSTPADGMAGVTTTVVIGDAIDFEVVQRRIAQRADELVGAKPGRVSRGEARRLWIKAEHQILGAASRIALADLLRLSAAIAGLNRLDLDDLVEAYASRVREAGHHG